MAPKPRPALERFEAMIDRSGECWQWTGSIRPNGYASFYVDNKTTSAHRFAYTAFIGPIPEGLVIDHLCRNRSCVKPAHLESVPQRQNVLRGASVTAEVVRRNSCVNGHELTEDNVYRWRGRPDQRMCRACHRVRQYARTYGKRAA